MPPGQIAPFDGPHDGRLAPYFMHPVSPFDQFFFTGLSTLFWIALLAGLAWAWLRYTHRTALFTALFQAPRLTEQEQKL